MNKKPISTEQRWMIEEQIMRRGIRDKRLLEAFGAVPRHLFIPDEYLEQAYADGPLPIGHGQTISQPYIVALMIDGLQLEDRSHVLEIGTGCGYQTAILAHLAASVVSIEIIPELSLRATRILKKLGLDNVQVITGDGSMGWKPAAPYDSILVSAAAPGVPAPLLAQLADGGRLVLPVGSRGFQHLEIWRRQGADYETEISIPVAFVPLRGKHGWQVAE